MDPKELKELLERSNAEIQAQYAKAMAEIKAAGDVSVETKSALENLKKQIDDIRAEMLKPHQPAPNSAEQKSLGQQFIESEQFKAFCKRGWHKGGVGMEVNSDLLRKTTITSSTIGSSTPGILTPERFGEYVAPPRRRIRVRSLIPFGRTTSNAVEYVKRNVFTNVASPQVEGSDKSESALTLTIGSATVRTLAHWIPATRQVLDDFAQLQSIINTELLDGLADEEDEQLLSGDGTGVNLSGLVTNATAYAGTYDAASDTRIDKLNHAIAELNASNYVPDGIVLNPVDWRIIQVIKTNEGGANLGPYILGGPGAALPDSLWGLPVATTTAMTIGTFLVGQFAGSVRGFDRMDATIDVSTEHSDYFIKNLVAIRAEERLTIAVTRGAGFRYGSF